MTAIVTQLQAFRWGIQDARGEPSTARWLREVRRLRGQVLLANGLRPEFDSGGSEVEDCDPLDLHSVHVVAHDREQIVGCVRVTPVVSPVACTSVKTLGQAGLDGLLERLKMDPSEVVEHGRWFVHTDYQSTGAGIFLMAASFAVAHSLGFPCSVATVRREVVPILTRVGARPAPGIGPIQSTRYDYQLVVLYGRQLEFSVSALQSFQRVADLLGLGPIYEPISACIVR